MKTEASSQKPKKTAKQADVTKLTAKEVTTKKPVAKKVAKKVSTKTFPKKVAVKKPVLKKTVKAATIPSVDATTVNFEEVAAFNQNNFDAVAKSNTLFAEGMQALGLSMFGYARELISSHGVVVQKILKTQDAHEILEVQQTFVKDICDEAIKETQNFSSRTAKLAEDVSAPISERLTEVAETISKNIAA